MSDSPRSVDVLAPVYAVEWRVEDGVAFYEPRGCGPNAVCDTPRLWVDRLCAEGMAEGRSSFTKRAKDPLPGRVVRFHLCPTRCSNSVDKAISELQIEVERYRTRYRMLLSASQRVCGKKDNPKGFKRQLHEYIDDLGDVLAEATRI